MATYSNWKNMNSRILRALQSGSDFSANQLRSKFGIRRVSDRISELRKAGYAIYLNTKTTRNGETIKVYRLGQPTRAQVAAGYFAQKSGMFHFDVQDALNFVN
jgi:predicted ArsR family transcriptional regulator